MFNEEDRPNEEFIDPDFDPNPMTMSERATQRTLDLAQKRDLTNESLENHLPQDVVTFLKKYARPNEDAPESEVVAAMIKHLAEARLVAPPLITLIPDQRLKISYRLSNGEEVVHQWKVTPNGLIYSGANLAEHSLPQPD